MKNFVEELRWRGMIQDIMPETEEHLLEGLRSAYVGIDPNAQGIAQGELIEKLWKENPDLDLNKDGVIQYVMLTGEPGHPDAVARTKYSISTLNDHGIKTEELHQDTAMWDTATAKDKMDAWLSGPNGSKIEVVISNNEYFSLILRYSAWLRPA